MQDNVIRRLEGDTAELCPQTREFVVDRAKVDVDKRTVELTFSSEQPYERWWGVEILDHSESAINLDRLNSRAALLVNHDMSDQVGVIERAWLDGKNGRAVVRFSRSARGEEILQDVRDGIRSLVSVGYQIDEMRLEGRSQDVETYRVTRWTPFEVSVVSVPADPTVGIGRELESGPRNAVRIFRADSTPPKGVTQKGTEMTDKVNEAPSAGEKADKQEVRIDVIDNEMGKQLEKSRVSALTKLGREYEISADVVQEWIDKDVTVSDAGRKVVEIMAKRSNEKTSKTNLDLSKKDVSQYSILRAIRAITTRDWDKAGFELECHREIATRLHREVDAKSSVFIPLDIQVRRLNNTRDFSTGTPSAGGYLVGTQNVGFIELLRNRSVAFNMGATRLSGLQGNVTIPRQTAAGTGYWLADETTQITESQPTLAQLSLAPKNVGAYTEISRQLMMQSSPDAESLVMSDLAQVVALAVDVAAIRGSGSGQPTGVVNTSGIGAVTGTSIDYAKTLEFQTDVAAANALSASCGYVTTPAVASIMMQRVKVSSTYSPLWEGSVLDGTVVGFRAMSSNQMSSGTMLFGDWTQLVVAEWGILELEVNPYADFKAAISGVRAIYTCDIGVRVPGAFSYASSVT